MRQLFQVALAMVVVVALAAMSANAQMPIRFGFKGGLSMTGVTGDDADDYETKSGLAVGLFTNISLSGGLSIQPELLYVQKGAKLSDESEGSITLKANYVEIPVLLKLGFGNNGPATPCLFVGPAFAFSAGSKTNAEGTLLGVPVSVDIDNSNEESSDLGLVLGGGVDFSLGRAKLTMELRYTAGLQPMWKDTRAGEVDPPDELPYADVATGKAFDMKNRAVSVMAGLMF